MRRAGDNPELLEKAGATSGRRRGGLLSKKALRIALLASAAATASLALAVGGAQGVESSEDRRLPESPPGQALVVNANLQEAFPDDMADPTDMRNFARRLTDQVPYAPDALLLSEVRTLSAGNVARFMEAETGDRYVVAAKPSSETYQADGSVRDNAILLNAETFRALDDGGVIRSEYQEGETREDRDPRVKEHALLLAKERRGGLRLAMAGLHYTTNGNFRTEELAYAAKERWTREIADLVDERYPSPSRRQVEVIAGDFNARRCFQSEDSQRRDPVDCPQLSGFWTALTDGYGYTDSIFDLYGGSNATIEPHFYKESGVRIDFLFGRGDVVDADSDTSYGPVEQEDPAIYYSDHRFLWSVVGPENPEVKR